MAGMDPKEVALFMADQELQDVVNPILKRHAEAAAAVIVAPIVAKLDVLGQQSSPFFAANSIELGVGSVPYMLLAQHRGRKRAVISASASCFVGGRDEVNAGGFALLNGSSFTIETTAEVWVRAPQGSVVSVWAEYAEV